MNSLLIPKIARSPIVLRQSTLMVARYERSTQARGFANTPDDVVINSPSFPDLSGGHSGFQLALFRTANIIRSVTEGFQVTKLLNIHCTADLPNFIHKMKNIDMTGCTDDKETAEICRKMKHYNVVNVTDFSNELPYGESTFNAIICLRPIISSPDYDPNRPFCKLESISRCLNYGGFAVFGACESELFKFNLSQELQEYPMKYGLIPAALQKISCDKKPSDGSSSTDLGESVDGNYVLITLLKR